MTNHERAQSIINDIVANHLPRVMEGLKVGYIDENQILVIYDHAVRARILRETGLNWGKEPQGGRTLTADELPAAALLAPQAPCVWTRDLAVELCAKVEAICPKFGCHVALTGGLLYKEGSRKDCDLLFYRIRQVQKIDIAGLFNALSSIGFIKTSGFGWCYKAMYQGRPVDCFFPEIADVPMY